MSQDLAAYIQSARTKGMSDDAIKSIMYNMNYDKAAVDAAFRELAGGSPTTPIVADSTQKPAVTVVDAKVAPATAVAAVPASSGSGKKNIIRAALVAVGILLLGSAGAIAYMKLSAPDLAPQEVMASMLGNLGQARSFEYRLELNTDIREEGTSTVSVLGSQSGSYDLNFSGAVEYPRVFQGTAILGITTSDLQGSATFEMRMVDNKFFVRLASMSQLGMLAAFLGPFQGQWISIEDAKSSSDSLQLDIDVPEVDASKLARFKQALLNNFPLVVTAELPVEEVSGVSSYHYAFRLDEEKTVALMMSLAALGEDPVSEADIRSSVKDALVGAKDMKGEIWIGQKDLLPRKMSFSGPYSVVKKQNVTASGNTTTTLTFGAFNQPVTVAAPTDAKSMGEIVEGFFGTPAAPIAP